VRYPNFYFEKKLWEKGFKYVAGVDEVGRGSFAGPVVAGCIIFPRYFILASQGEALRGRVRVDDSKKLTAKQRERAEEWIKKNALTWGIGSTSVSEINKKGMTAATRSTFRRAIQDANKRGNIRANYLLLDAFYIPYIRGIRMPRKNIKIKNRRAIKVNNISYSGNQLAIVRGDQKSFSIAAASIIAKVYRDNQMQKLGKITKYKKYEWEKNKGYGTRKHQNAIRRYGTTRYHRKKFIETFLSKKTNETNL
jgi:ribonuclease HII